MKSESFDGKLRYDDCNKLMVETPMSQPAAERTTFPPNARPIIYRKKKKLQSFNEACAKCNTLLANKCVTLKQTFWSIQTISLYVGPYDGWVLLFI